MGEFAVFCEFAQFFYVVFLFATRAVGDARPYGAPVSPYITGAFLYALSRGWRERRYSVGVVPWTFLKVRV